MSRIAPTRLREQGAANRKVGVGEPVNSGASEFSGFGVSARIVPENAKIVAAQTRGLVAALD
jgi:hypothetical protein